MKLIIDVGNTNTKLAVIEKKNILKRYIYSSNREIDLSLIFSKFQKIKYIFFCGKNKILDKQVNSIIKDKSVIILYWESISKFMIDANTTTLIVWVMINWDHRDTIYFPNFKNHLIIDIGTCTNIRHSLRQYLQRRTN